MSDPHIPVLRRQAVELLKICEGGVYIDGTFGAGGYSRAILAAADCNVIGIDRDASALTLGAELMQKSGGRLILVHDRFSRLDAIARNCGYEQVDGVVLDLGISSMQLEQAERGFSFRLDGPLDMRMTGEGSSAAEVVNAASERDLSSIIYTLGEERFSRGIARAIVRARQHGPIAGTKALADIVAGAVRTKPSDIHPATRTFQALRIFVNDELHELAQALIAAERILRPGGRLAVVSFHSLEDRIVKTFLAARSETRGGSRHAPEVKRDPPSFSVLTKRPVVAEVQEVAANPRARSAKLRAGERTDAPVHRSNVKDFLPRLPSLADVVRGL
jgi:16S rRNA (cytosine1402-N4)-methyltransferase